MYTNHQTALSSKPKSRLGGLALRIVELEDLWLRDNCPHLDSRQKVRTLVPPSRWLVSYMRSFIADQRGAVAFETLIVWLFMTMGLLLPLSDLAIAGFKFIAAQQALRDMAQRTQYNPPADVTTSSGIGSWTSSLPTTVAGFPITAKVYCGNPGTLAPCAPDPPGTASPKYYTFSTSFTLSPMVLGSYLCSTCAAKYSQPFQ